jgi:hypothetical protein
MCYREHNCITALPTTNNGEDGPYFDAHYGAIQMPYDIDGKSIESN